MINYQVYDRPSDIDNFPVITWALINKYSIKEGDSLLDIGGASGEFLDIINTVVRPIRGTVWEPDEECIKLGRKKHPEFQFIHGEFPLKPRMTEKYDVVLMESLFPLFSNWKQTVLEMVKLSRRVVSFQALFREQGTTVDDDQRSFFYYMDTGERVSQVILNIYEFLSFLCLEEVRARAIYVVGEYQIDEDGREDILEKMREIRKQGKSLDGSEFVFDFAMHSFRGVPWYDVFNAQVYIEVFDENENPKRMGGIGKENEDKYPDYDFFRPIIKVIIDQKTFLEIKDDKMTVNARCFLNNPMFVGKLQCPKHSL